MRDASKAALKFLHPDRAAGSALNGCFFVCCLTALSAQTGRIKTSSFQTDTSYMLFRARNKNATLFILLFVCIFVFRLTRSVIREELTTKLQQLRHGTQKTEYDKHNKSIPNTDTILVHHMLKRNLRQKRTDRTSRSTDPSPQVDVPFTTSALTVTVHHQDVLSGSSVLVLDH